jgi:amino acid transporter
MSMSRDGLLPKKFSTIHPRYKTPSFATIVTGFVVAIPALFMNLTMVTDLCSIGTLFAFVLVCAGVLRMDMMTDIPKGKFRTPYINAKYIMLPLLVLAIFLSWKYNSENTFRFLKNEPVTVSQSEFISRLTKDELFNVKSRTITTDSLGFISQNSDLDAYVQSLDEKKYGQFLSGLSIPEDKKITEGWILFRHKIPTWIFIITSLVLIYYSITKNLSLIPLLGLTSCLYMMSELGVSNWIGFTIWLMTGLIIYFTYSYKNSKLNVRSTLDVPR